jgi:tetratricopeptide (TPR) repeat protein
MLAVVSLVVAQAVSAGPGAPSARPADCREGSALRHANVWERAKAPDLQRYCDLLATAASKLAGVSPAPAPAIEAARAAEALLPGKAPARVLEGRALALLGHLPEALAAFEDARARDPRAFDEPAALLSLSRVYAASGRDAEASRAYSDLLPRLSELSAAERSAIAIEAGIVAMRVGPRAVEEAIADLREALRGARGEAERFAVLALALALDRGGQEVEARTLLVERARGEPRAAVAAWSRGAALALRPAEAAALAALALEGSDPAGARDEWSECVEDGSGPWVRQARDHLALLRAGPPAGKPR